MIARTPCVAEALCSVCKVCNEDFNDADIGRPSKALSSFANNASGVLHKLVSEEKSSTARGPALVEKPYTVPS